MFHHVSVVQWLIVLNKWQHDMWLFVWKLRGIIMMICAVLLFSQLSPDHQSFMTGGGLIKMPFRAALFQVKCSFGILSPIITTDCSFESQHTAHLQGVANVSQWLCRLLFPPPRTFPCMVALLVNHMWVQSTWSESFTAMSALSLWWLSDSAVRVGGG